MIALNRSFEVDAFSLENSLAPVRSGTTTLLAAIVWPRQLQMRQYIMQQSGEIDQRPSVL